MWTTTYTATTDQPPAAVWAALRALHSGYTPSAASDRFELHGPFAVGTRISMTPAGQDTVESVITAVQDERLYEDRTDLGDVALVFRFELSPAGTGTRVDHTLEIEGPGADETGPQLGPAISADFPVATAELFAAAAAGVR
ncbi:SRPBCC family protein [Cellulomonas citrea]|uniref:SRPBCC family protein n=1 Tax=Cellulomonas citrea TaxID=1909423 RepID=UPI001359C004|nr:SRPBCC family protein [Cellulomonas citrea]